jgi:hypothetical protein
LAAAFNALAPVHSLTQDFLVEKLELTLPERSLIVKDDAQSTYDRTDNWHATAGSHAKKHKQTKGQKKRKRKKTGREALFKVVAINEEDAGRDSTTRRRCEKF